MDVVRTEDGGARGTQVFPVAEEDPSGEPRPLERPERVWLAWRRECERDRQWRDLRDGLQTLAVLAAYALIAGAVLRWLRHLLG